ncbi:MAG: DUF4375 domain-containing protein [Planctomycetaceae bacterium]|nr:DUF4375 domain-containing protein [Planctomycetaceae bacterium]
MDATRELDTLCQTLAPKVQRGGLRALSEPERTVFLVGSFATALDNGGPDSFFYNDSGRFAEQTVEALQTISARPLAKWLEKAIQGFPDGEVPDDIDERTDALDEVATDLEDVFERLRDAYEELGPERMRKATLRYWQAQTGAPGAGDVESDS